MSSRPAPLDVKTSRDTLSKVMTLPQEVSAVRWVQIPMGNPNASIPGPTDYRIVAYLEVPDEHWPSVLENIGGTQTPRRLTMSRETLAALLPQNFAFPNPDEKGRVSLNLPRIKAKPFETGGPYKASFGYKTDHGLLIALMTL